MSPNFISSFLIS
uniref:Uncharacterized protein n=1 Tax=Lepeophtheirus salmonis TaxID=72036 RepID=A0A0K2UK92_LEPSM